MNQAGKIQCNYCTFYVSESQNTPEKLEYIENKYKLFSSLSGYQKKAIPRTITVIVDEDTLENKSEYCCIDSPNWTKRNTNYCPDLMDLSFSRESAISLREDRRAIRIAFDAKIWAIIAAIIATIASAVPKLIE